MKNIIVRDNFISKLLGYDAFITKNYNIQKLSKIKKPFFVSLKSKSKIKKSTLKKTKNFTNNNLIKNKQKIYAGTSVYNIPANNFYKKVGFQKTKVSTYNYHIHSN